MYKPKRMNLDLVKCPGLKTKSDRPKRRTLFHINLNINAFDHKRQYLLFNSGIFKVRENQYTLFSLIKCFTKTILLSKLFMKY